MLLKTKLHLPKPTPHAIHRSKVLNCFSLDARLTLLIAPTGYGKTNLVLEWLDSLSMSTGWITLDERDNDISQFIPYLLAACEKASLELAKLRTQISEVTSSISTEYILTTLINIFVDSANPFFLVLDDYHFIHNPAIHHVLIFLIEHKPPHLHLIIMSRSEPPFSIGKWRAKNEVTELRVADLKLSLDEIENFLTIHKVPNLSPQNIQALAKRTEGWIAALQLVVIALKGKENPSQFVADFTGSHIYMVDYLSDEVKQQQPTHIQQFLMKTALLSRFNADLCNHLLQIDNSHIILQELEAQNLFLIRLDNQREWYRYHHLFQDTLCYWLQREAHEQLPILHRCASQWFVQHGWLEEGITHAGKAEAWHMVIETINQHAFSLFGQGKMRTVQRWFSTLPHDLLLAHPQSCLNYACALNLTGETDKMTRYLHQAEHHLQNAPQSEIFQGVLFLLKGYQARRQNECCQSIQYLEEALNALPANHPHLQATTHVNLGVAYLLQNHLSQSQHHFTQVQHIAHQHDTYSFVAAVGLQAMVNVAKGQLQKAEQHCRQLLDTIHSHPGLGYVTMTLGDILRETNRLPEAETLLKQTIDLGHLSADYTIVIHSLLTLAQLYQHQQHLTDAGNCLQQAHQLMQETHAHYGTYHYDMTQLQQWLLENNTTAIKQWLSQHSPPTLSINYQLIYAMGKIGIGECQQAIHLLENISIPPDHRQTQTQSQLLLAIAYQQVRDHDRSRQALTKALALAEPAGYQQIFSLFPHLTHQCLKDLLTRNTPISIDYISTLIKLLQNQLNPPQTLDNPLTNQEKTVLRLMTAGLSNRAIAQELVISIGTVKGYSHNIYTKLAVSNRQDAIKKAVELDLF